MPTHSYAEGSDEFLMLQHYGLSEALYDTPFYWMCADKAYKLLRHWSIAARSLEVFAAERLAHVFGSNRRVPEC